MAKEAEKKPNIFVRFGKGIVRFVKWIGRSFKDMYHELKKVTWPTKRELLNYSLVVLAFMVIMGVIIGLIDFGAGALVDLLIS